jgi:transposase-like protein
MRRVPKVTEVLPILYLRGLSTGDFQAALPVLLGEDATGLSPTTITRLTASSEGEYHAWRRRDLHEVDYVYVWVDGVHFRVRLEEDRLCSLVMIGVRADGTKELIAVEDGYRESTDSWAAVLRDLKRRGLRAPVVAVGDSALGFWAAVGAVWPKTHEQAPVSVVAKDGHRVDASRSHQGSRQRGQNREAGHHTAQRITGDIGCRHVRQVVAQLPDQ